MKKWHNILLGLGSICIVGCAHTQQVNVLQTETVQQTTQNKWFIHPQYYFNLDETVGYRGGIYEKNVRDFRYVFTNDTLDTAIVKTPETIKEWLLSETFKEKVFKVAHIENITIDASQQKTTFDITQLRYNDQDKRYEIRINVYYKKQYVGQLVSVIYDTLVSNHTVPIILFGINAKYSEQNDTIVLDMLSLVRQLKKESS